MTATQQLQSVTGSLSTTLQRFTEPLPASPLRRSASPLRSTVANFNLTDRRRGFSGSVTPNQPDFFEFRLDNAQTVRINVRNRSSSFGSNPARLDVRLRDNNRQLLSFGQSASTQGNRQIRLNKGRYRVELRTPRGTAQYSLELSANRVPGTERIDAGDLTRKQRTYNNFITRDNPDLYSFRLTSRREALFELRNLLDRQFFDFLGGRSISATLSGSGTQVRLFTTSPGDRDLESTILRPGNYRLELKTTDPERVNYRLRLVG